MAAMLLAVCALVLRKSMVRMYATLRNGVATLAEVTEARRGRIAFVFTTEAGLTQNGTAVIARRKVRRLPATGERIVVIYDPARPSGAFVVALLPGVRFE